MNASRCKFSCNIFPKPSMYVKNYCIRLYTYTLTLKTYRDKALWWKSITVSMQLFRFGWCGKASLLSRYKNPHGYILPVSIVLYALMCNVHYGTYIHLFTHTLHTFAKKKFKFKLLFFAKKGTVYVRTFIRCIFAPQIQEAHIIKFDFFSHLQCINAICNFLSIYTFVYV